MFERCGLHKPETYEDLVKELHAEIGGLAVANSFLERMGFVAQMAKGDSSRESSVVAGPHEQTDPTELQDQELAGL